MLTVWSVCNGTKYTDEDVYILRDMVHRNLSTPHVFRCLSDRPIPDIDCFIPSQVWPGWWSKLQLFRYSTGLNLYLDLDVVVTGPLDGLLSDALSMPANWGQSGHGGCQSSVMSWGWTYAMIPAAFNVNELEKPVNGNCGAYHGLWGDQEYITKLLGDPGDIVKPMEGIYSYKYHCQKALPEGAKVVCFHGEPKPHDVNDQWVRDSRQRTIPSAGVCRGAA